VTIAPADGWSDKDQDPVFLHVWGGSVDERVPVKGRERDPGEVGLRRRQDPIPIPPSSQPFYYFAQLENAALLPVSRPIALKETRPDETATSPSTRPAGIGAAEGDAPRPGAESRCPGVKNLIQLTLAPVGAEAAPVALGE